MTTSTAIQQTAANFASYYTAEQLYSMLLAMGQGQGESDTRTAVLMAYNIKTA